MGTDPELAFRGAYFLLLGPMLGVVALILSIFYRRGWLGRRRRH
ncbi:MAG: hypothetical protein OER90_09475 [Gemmatimonadota bacterium]|nr:hypothetical protein [Gemmatimonadota bacterium]